MIESALDKMQSPYVAFSTGKDSTVVLDIVRHFYPDVSAVYIDADCAFPESESMLNRLQNDGVNLIRFKCTPFLEILHEHGITNPHIENITLRKTVYEPVKALKERYGFDGCFLGLRTEESVGRYFLRKQRGLTFFCKRYGQWECQPIADWTFNDVWAYLISRHVDYNSYYDLVRAFPEREQRLSYWAGESNISFGRWQRLNQTHPELFHRFQMEFPEIRAFI